MAQKAENDAKNKLSYTPYVTYCFILCSGGLGLIPYDPEENSEQQWLCTLYLSSTRRQYSSTSKQYPSTNQ